MTCPRLTIQYPAPEHPEYGTATTPYDIQALIAWATAMQAWGQELENKVEELIQDLRNKGVLLD